MESRELIDPLGFIDSFFQAKLEANEGKLDCDDYGEHEAYEALLQRREFVEKIPYLNQTSLGRIPHNALVRYRGLVQDVYNEEYFTGVYEQKTVRKGSGSVVSSNLILSKYRDVIDEPQTTTTGDEVRVNDFESPKCRIMQRQSVLCVPIPGESDWVQEYCRNDDPLTTASASGSSSGGKKKRASEPSVSDETTNLKVQNSTADIENMNNAKPPPIPEDETSPSGSATKRVSFSGLPPDEPDCEGSGRSIDHPSFYTNEGGGNLCCLAKVYDHQEGESCVRLNDMIEVVGVYSLESANEDVTAASSSSSSSSTDAMDCYGSGGSTQIGVDGETEMLQWPASIAPRVHVLSFRKIEGSFPLVRTHAQSELFAQKGKVGGAMTIMPVTKSVPKLGAYCSESSGSGSMLIDSDTIFSARKAIVSALTKALMGDSLAAEYCLLSALCRVIGRHDDTVVGSLPLMLGVGSSWSSTTVGQLQQSLVAVFKTFMPRVTRLQADLASLNAVNFCPVKDYDRNIILPSPLQLGEGTALIVDETSMSEGRLSAQGVQSVRALSGVCQRQTLQAKFAYCDVTVRTDCPVLAFVRSSGNNYNDGNGGGGSDANFKSLFDNGTSVKIPLKIDTVYTAVEAPEDGDLAESGRMDMDEETPPRSEREQQRTALYWASVRLIDATMGESLIQKAESDFVAARTSSPSSSSSSSSSPSSGSSKMVDQGDFSRWLTVARLLAISEGSGVIEERHWLYMREMEAAREARLR